MKKSGIEYFPMPVNLGLTFKVLEAKFGMSVYAVYLKLLQTIFRDNGYYASVDEDFYLVFASEVKSEEQEIKNIITTFVDRGLFDKDLFSKNKILTSDEIQKEYINATKKRKGVNMLPEYCLDYAKEFFCIKSKNLKATNYNIVKSEEVEKSLLNKLSKKVAVISQDEITIEPNLKYDKNAKNKQSDLWENQSKTAKREEDFNKVNKIKEKEIKVNEIKINARPSECYCTGEQGGGEQKKRDESNFQATRVRNGVEERIYSKDFLKDLFTNIDDIEL